MQSNPAHLNDPAQLLVEAMSDLGIKVEVSDARNVIAKLDDAHVRGGRIALIGPKGADVCEAIVTVDVTQSAKVRVHARSPEEANELLLTAAHAQYPRGFELNEGNTVDVEDFYLGDEDAVENLSEPQYSSDGELSGTATWTDEFFDYKVEMLRKDPDNSDEEVWSKVSVTLSISDERGHKIERMATHSPSWSGLVA